MNAQPRPEHPRPQFYRKTWQNLNGPWTFTFDPGRSGLERGLARSTGFDQTILVPFCPESRLSGVAHTDFIPCLWYHRAIVIPQEWSGRRILIHFGGVDYEAEVFLDGRRVGHHWGGSTLFSLDLTRHVTPGAQHHLVVHVRDDIRAGWQPAGKQSASYHSAGCHYTRTTGIWSTVWMEGVHPDGLHSVQILPNLDGRCFVFIPTFHSWRNPRRWRAIVSADGRTVGYDGRSVTVRDPRTGETLRTPTGYTGKSQDFFRLVLGPDGYIYASTAMPIHFVRADPEGEGWEEVGQPGGGEFYSFLSYGDTLIGAAYSGQAPIMIYRPDRPYAPAPSPEGNPWLIHYEGENAGWRPMALIAGPGGKVYIGAVSGYGLLGGPLCVLDPATGTVDEYLHLVRDQSVVALAALPEQGLIVGGTTVGGGGGSHPTQTDARLFLWDPETREKLLETVPVPGEGGIQALALGPDGLIYGFAGPMVFVFDPAARAVVETAPHGLGGVIYNAVALADDGQLYGLATGGIFTLDTATRRPRILAAYPGGISGGFALRGRRLYFISGPQIVSYALP